MKIETTRFVRSVVEEKDFLHDGVPQIAFAGRSNVGKSSLLNRMLGRKALARISSKPGKTRAVNYFMINSRFYFVDLPGFGYAKVSKQERREWAVLMERYLRGALATTRVVQLVDAKVGATPLDIQAMEYLRGMETQPIVVATKIDRVSRNKRKVVLERIQQDLALDEGCRPIPCSAQTGEGVKEIWKEIQSFLYQAESGTGPEAKAN